MQRSQSLEIYFVIVIQASVSAYNYIVHLCSRSVRVIDTENINVPDFSFALKYIDS